MKEETANAWLASESPEAALSQSVYNVQPSVHPTVDASSPLRDGVPLRDQVRIFAVGAFFLPVLRAIA